MNIGVDWEQKIAGMIDDLARTLGTTTKYLWGVLVTQGYVAMYKMIFAFIVLTTVSVLCFALASRREWGDDSKFILLWAGSGLAVLAVAAFCNIQTPEMYALDAVMEAVK